MPLILDFDSTLVTIETLDALCQDDSIRDEIEDITNAAMEGTMNFETALRARLKILKLRRTTIEILKATITQFITPSVFKNREMFSKDCYIVSGGFKEIILPVAKYLGIPEDRVFANDFVYENNIVVAADYTNPLSKDGGKIEVVRQLNLTNAIMVGDGWSDYQVRQAGAVDEFCAFTEIVARPKVIQVADRVAWSFDILAMLSD